MISPDAPIKRIEDDKLGRAPFARALAKTLLANAAEESFVLGVHGRWGTGKSSVLNMCVEELRSQSKDSGQCLEILHFDPWNVADQSQLVLQFFRRFTGHLRKLDKKGVGKIKNLVETLDAYAATLGHRWKLFLMSKQRGRDGARAWGSCGALWGWDRI